MLTVSHLNFGYNLKPLLSSNFSWTFPTHGIISVLGPNGAGKSTLLKTLSGLITPLQGEILFNNQNIHKLSYDQKSKIFSILLPTLPQNLPLTVEEILKLKNPAFSNEEIIHTLQIKHLTHKNFNTLSDGQKQRVMIAKTFSRNTPIILLDEPEAHLDLMHLEILYQLMSKLAEKKLIIFTSHNINFTLKISHYTLLFDNQKLQAYLPEDLLFSHSLEKKFNISTSMAHTLWCNNNSEEIINSFKTKHKINFEIAIQNNSILCTINSQTQQFKSFKHLLKYLESAR